MSYQRVLVTGGTGFIGSHLVERLLAGGRYVKVLVMKEPIMSIEKDNLALIQTKGAEVIQGDLRKKESLHEAVKEIDCIFHLGAISMPMKIPEHVYFDTNAQGTKNIVELALQYGIKRFIHVSTVSVLGISPDGHPLKENEFQDYNQLYGLSKRAGEQLVRDYHQQHNLPAIILRPSLTYGPRCLVRLVMFKFAKMRLFPMIQGGNAKFEFCYVDNFIDALLLAEQNDGVIGEVFNITDGQSYSVRKVIETMAAEQGVGPSLLSLPYSVAKGLGYMAEFFSKAVGIHPPFSRTAADWLSKDENVYDCSKAKHILGFTPKISLREGVRRSIIWYRKNQLLG